MEEEKDIRESEEIDEESYSGDGLLLNEESEDATKTVDNLSYKCPQCAMPLKFDNKMNRFVCEYCDGSFALHEIKDAENDEEGFDWNDYKETVHDENLEGTVSYVCEFCGAEVLTSAITSATKCPYCGNVLVISEKISGVLRPNKIIPFAIEREQLKELFNRFVTSKPFVPKLFKNNPVLSEVEGIYEPFWLYDSTVDGKVEYKATKIRSWSDSKYDYVETKYYQVGVDGSVCYANVPADGSKRLDDNTMDSLEPFRYDEMIDFEPGYLSGHMAERFDVDADANLQRTKVRMWNSTEAQFRTYVKGYSSVAKSASNLVQSERDAHYALLPVYVFSIMYGGKKYEYAVNGQTGKIVGELPFSKKMYLIWKWTRILLIAVIIYLLYFIFN